MARQGTPRSAAIATEAARLFAQRGYGATTIDDIGAAAGVSGPAIYWHYQGKQALLAAMLLDISERLLAGGQQCVAEASSPAEALERLVDQQVDFAIADPDLIVVHTRDLHHLDPGDAHRVRLLQRQYVDVWVDVLAAVVPGQQRSTVSAVVQAAIGLVNSTPYLDRADAEALRPVLRTMALAALRAV
ncbi:MAG: TetR/AcrR family transcriptional regulator, partial [Actinobacteria bacterium]|nr:TetR/AcrR family transcriptional regulator [Actinomycetota bacterium]